MLESQHLLEEGIILRTHLVRESDLFATILTQRAGKVLAVARGAKRSVKRFFGGLEVFDGGLFELIPPRHRFPNAQHSSHVFTLHGLTERKYLAALRKSLERFSSATLCLEAADAFAHEGDQAGSDLYEPLFQTLNTLALANDKVSCTNLTSLFLFFCLRHAGYDPLSAAGHPEDFPTWVNQISTHDFSNPDLGRSTISADLANRSFLYLTHYSQSTLGKELKSLQGRSVR